MGDMKTVQHVFLNKEESRRAEKLADALDPHARLTLPELYANPRAETLPKNQHISQYNVPPAPPNTRTKVQGKPIDLETAKAVRRILFGDATHFFTKDWQRYRFHFRDPASAIPYGLNCNSAGARAFCLCMQCYILKHLLFVDAEDEDKPFGRAPPEPTSAEQTTALINAICDILWKLSHTIHSEDDNIEKKQVIVSLPGDSPCFETLGNFLADGLIEKLWLFTIVTQDELRKFIKRNLHFFCDEGEQGGILLMYSIVLSHTPETIHSELAQCQRSILTENSRPTQAFINLLLSGAASCFVHNGVIKYDKHGRELEIPLPGPRKRSEIGFLFFDKTEGDDNRTTVGCMLRTPLLPIWITQVNGSYGLIFCTSRDLVADWKIERFFTINYYTGHYTQVKATSISVDTRRRAFLDPSREISYWDDEEEKERKQPSLERTIGTKWPEALLNWNGETPYY
uniref:inactive ubiquitin carboxyl-terminal hydrolase MINDY-4B-like n=1 Tax=Styela clava TaxID=7725 RepID=UPI00193A58A8|nr:inactive ubiquitin carboxyl-terminal hydrolase MINDY-4B-like [Styela clava]